MEQLTFIDIWRKIPPEDGHKPKTWKLLAVAGSRFAALPVQMLPSLPVMVYPDSQVQWVVPCVMVHRDGRMFGPLVAAGRTEAAAVAEEVAVDVFVMVTKTEGGGQEENTTSAGCGTSSILRWAEIHNSASKLLVFINLLSSKPTPESSFSLSESLDVGIKQRL